MKSFTNRIKFIIAVILLPLTSWASTRWTVGSINATVDTLFCAQVGPGTTQVQLRLTGSKTDGSEWVNNVFYTVTDLTDPNVEMRAVKGGNTSNALETVPDISKRFSAPGQRYFASVNADFFNMDSPYNVIGATITHGSLDNQPPLYYSITGQLITDLKPGQLVIERRGPDIRKIIMR